MRVISFDAELHSSSAGSALRQHCSNYFVGERPAAHPFDSRFEEMMTRFEKHKSFVWTVLEILSPTLILCWVLAVS